MEAVLAKLKEYIKNKGLTIYKLTEMSDLSENTIYNWYNKGAEPSVHALYSICEILGISMAELFADDGQSIMTLQESNLLEDFRQLSAQRKEVVLNLVRELK